MVSTAQHNMQVLMGLFTDSSTLSWLFVKQQWVLSLLVAVFGA